MREKEGERGRKERERQREIGKRDEKKICKKSLELNMFDLVWVC